MTNATYTPHYTGRRGGHDRAFQETTHPSDGLTALGVALVICLAFVLPAETGKDPLHTGALFGLTSLSKAGAQGAVGGTASGSVAGASASLPAFNPTVESSAAGEAPVIHGVYVAQPAAYKIDSRQLVLDPGEGIEIKYHIQSGANAWSTPGQRMTWLATNFMVSQT